MSLPSFSDAGQGFVAALLLALGAGIKWLIEWLSGQRGSRMTKLEKKVDRLNAKVIMIGGACIGSDRILRR